jgi:hypothetical protein
MCNERFWKQETTCFFFQEVIQSLKDQIWQPFLMEIIILIFWAIWTTRNDFFKAVPPSVYR